MITITATDAWRSAHPGAQIGILEISGVDNTRRTTAWDEAKRSLEQSLRQQYAGYTRSDFMALPAMAAYDRYYNRFDKTYHVLLQLESVVLKGKPLPDVSPLVEAGFAAELQTLMLTAGHDVARLLPPVSIDVAAAGEEFTQMGGKRKRLLAGDMAMRDRQGIVCTIIYGQDDLSPISLATTHALYVAYVPAGIAAALVQAHLETILGNVRLFAPACQAEQLTLFRA